MGGLTLLVCTIIYQIVYVYNISHLKFRELLLSYRKLFVFDSSEMNIRKLINIHVFTFIVLFLKLGIQVSDN